MTASIVLAILLGEPTFDSWGPWLATLTGWQRAGVGLLVGLAAASPLVLLAFSQRVWVVAPLGFYGFTAWTYLTILWMPEGRAGRTSRSVSAGYFRSEADWYIVTSVLAFHVGIPLMIWIAWRLSRSPDDDEPVPGMVTKRRPKRRRASAG
ncbi:hypothetical protein [Blastococcus haudaquaticus]|uniref:Uncharacterized protein n=1 Tax=Blastococcus haudaquaticus TaxID=1938745 RepID=A0A286H917_9ACTN|nr:hypothetical protein [Blastococcus haudaquaticus]SOE03819.1 hypothetical protein SAMN06272739_4376 [Blastococcus haudaquaticus]